MVSQVSSEVAGGLTTTITIQNKTSRNDIPRIRTNAHEKMGENVRSRARQVGQNDSGPGRPNFTFRIVAEDDRRCIHTSCRLKANLGHRT